MTILLFGALLRSTTYIFKYVWPKTAERTPEPPAQTPEPAVGSHPDLKPSAVLAVRIIQAGGICLMIAFGLLILMALVQAGRGGLL